MERIFKIVGVDNVEDLAYISHIESLEVKFTSRGVVRDRVALHISYAACYKNKPKLFY